MKKIHILLVNPSKSSVFHPAFIQPYTTQIQPSLKKKKNIITLIIAIIIL